MLTNFFATNNSWIGTFLRATLALVILPHGAQKLMGWLGGFGFKGTMGYFTGQIGMPWILGLIVILSESFGSLFLLAGLGTRAVAALYIAIMIGAIATVHARNGFFMNWLGNQKGEGFEYALLVIGIASVLVVQGGGRLALDRSVAAVLGGAR